MDRLLALVVLWHLVAVSLAGQHRLTLLVHYATPSNHANSAKGSPTLLTVRGQGLPCFGGDGGDAWGIPIALNRSSSQPGLWTAVLPFEDAFVGAAVEFKVLLEDSHWQMPRPNQRVSRLAPGENAVTVLPWFVFFACQCEASELDIFCWGGPTTGCVYLDLVRHGQVRRHGG